MLEAFCTPSDVNVEPLFRRHETLVSSKYTPLILKKKSCFNYFKFDKYYPIEVKPKSLI